MSTVGIRSDLRDTSVPDGLSVFVFGGAVLTSVGVGVAFAGPTYAKLVAELVVGIAFLVPFARAGLGALRAWIVLAGVAYPFVRSGGSHAPVTFDRLWLTGLAVTVLISPPPSPRGRRVRIVLGAWLVLVASYGIRAGFTHGSALRALVTWFDAIALPLVAFLATERCASTARRTQQVAGAFAVSGVILSVLGISERMFGFELASRSGGAARYDAAIGVVRVSGPYNVPEVYALVLLVSLAATLYWVQSRRPARALGALVVSVELAAIGLTFFRAAWIGAIGILIASFGLRPQRFGKTIAVVAYVGVILFLGSSQAGVASAVSTRIDNTSNIKARLATYVDGIHIFERAPIYGVGVKNFEEASSLVPQAKYGGVSAASVPHSSYIGILAEQGVIGTIPFIVLTIGAWRLLRQFRRRAALRSDILLAACVTGACFAYLLMSVTLSMLPYGPSNTAFAVLLGLVAARFNHLTARDSETLVNS
jgi:O-antigen ligase